MANEISSIQTLTVVTPNAVTVTKSENKMKSQIERLQRVVLKQQLIQNEQTSNYNDTRSIER